ncbi:hypothetical protein MS3_00004940 [Schistosoma haematobium]|uniref:Hexosyltransferase n=2 Tax=Schistosoma haematobium TaxID=6185 RepID=A0A922ITN1_SCHHA|nr:hypothetical protein MS3_00004940 [Schistosoma haematobium]KAH9587060.1 hypothetical protein MS3_00004940 [Schistosoma haematobium]CAH8538996.1 unnamed protein product [Schistosoma haematobium]CAH8543166.1 unnamed protein product [Schistosoma haematobium]
MKLLNQIRNITLLMYHKFHNLFNSNNKSLAYFIIIMFITILYYSILMKLINPEVTYIIAPTSSGVFIQFTNNSLSANYTTEIVTHRITSSTPIITTKTFHPQRRHHHHHHHRRRPRYGHKKMRLRKVKSLNIIKSKFQVHSRLNWKTKNNNDVLSQKFFPPLYLNHSFCLNQSNFHIDNEKYIKFKKYRQIINLPNVLRVFNISQWFKIKPTICQSSKINLLIIIFSPIIDHSIRYKIRQTWGSIKYILSDTIINKQYFNGLNIIEHLFIVNITKYKFKQNSIHIQNLLKEAQYEKDILILCLNHLQNNLASLYLLTSEFLLNSCKHSIDFVLFINQDLFPNLNALIQYTNSKLLHLTSNTLKQNHNPSIYCIPMIQKHIEYNKRFNNLYKNNLPIWQGNIYPTYCDIKTGGFLLLFKTMKQWYTCSHLYIPFNPIQVYLTGFIRYIAKIDIENYWINYWSISNLLPSVSLNKKSKKYLFFQKSINQNSRVWKSVFRATLS